MRRRPAKPRQNLESILVADISDAFGSHPDIFMWRANTGGARTPSGRYVKFNTEGTADHIGVIKGGRFLAIESKAPDGVQSDDQRVVQRAIEERGGLYILARSVEDVRVALRAAGVNC